MLSLKFDPEAYKVQAIAGPFESRAAIDAASEKMNISDPAYYAWALKHDVDPQSGSIITTAYNPDLLNRRAAALESQLVERGGGPASGLSYQIPPNLLAAFEDASQEREGPLNMLVISTTRENLHFDLQKEFPRFDLQTIVAAPNDAYAEKCNLLIQTKAPDLSGKLVYNSAWQDKKCDLVAINPALHYYDEEGLKTLVGQISETGAKRAVFSNIMKNDDPNGAAQWKAQRYSGGVIALRIPARGELKGLMQKAGYSLVEEKAGPTTFDLNSASSFAAQNPELDHLSFIRN